MTAAIATARLLLEPLEPSHAAALFDGLQAAAIYQFLDDEPPRDVDGLTERYRMLSGRRSPDGRELWLNWAIRAVQHQVHVGYVQATVRPGGDAEIAYVLVPAWWGRGFAREAVAAMLDALRDQHHIRRFSALVHPGNLRSVALLEHLGFVPAGTRPTPTGTADLVYRLVR